MTVHYTSTIDVMVAQIQAIFHPIVVDKLMRIMAFNILALMKLRIFTQGRKADGNAIGEYSDKYLQVRQKQYNRTGDRKIILSLTRQMENDLKVDKLPNGEWGIGLSNAANDAKADANEQRFGAVFALTADEEAQMEVVISEELKRLLE